ncbi:helix-turn-helix domain-containing protein [Kordiimonas pumila]|uniref:Helix-turn-helix domain-containing protein n=1 Tax=Kordiimonas pumila TaxID=2161677 RepID=A0ABV7D5K4_9PROT|nr:helix-turn-helix transcriptional regulator [Kordiimonas pumila]
MSSHLGQKVKELRIAKGYSLDKLAELTGSSKSYIWSIENPQPKKKMNPSAEKVSKISQVLGVTSTYLLDDTATLDDSTLKDALYRDFKDLSQEDQAKVKQIIALWGKK